MSSSYDRHMIEQDRSIETFIVELGRVRTVFDLRDAWCRVVVGKKICYAPSEQFRRLSTAMICSLISHGLNIDSDDERVRLLMESYFNAEPDSLDRYDVGHNSYFVSAFYRILSALDISSPEDFCLAPFVPLVERDLTNLLYSCALDYTREDRYSVFDFHPRKAVRFVVDSSSPYWGFVVQTDDFPRNGPNLHLYMPTSRVSRDALIASRTKWDSDCSLLANKPLYMPTRLLVQAVQLGRSSIFSRHMDTSDSTVQLFLESIQPDDRDRQFFI